MDISHDPHTKRQSNSPRPKKSKSYFNTMLIVVFLTKKKREEGIVHLRVHSPRADSQSGIFLEVLQHLREIVRHLWLDKLVLHQNSAPADTAVLVR
jgi:hypothetical protein